MQPKVNGVWAKRPRSIVKVADTWHPVIGGWVKVNDQWRPFYNPPSMAIYDGLLTPEEYQWAGATGRGYGPFKNNMTAYAGKVSPTEFNNGQSHISHIGVFTSDRGAGAGNTLPAYRTLEISIFGGDQRDKAALLCNYNNRIGWLAGLAYDTSGDNTYLWYTFAEDVYFASDSPLKLSF